MSSVEEASASVGGNAEQARELTSGITASKDVIDGLIGALAALGLDGKTGHAKAASDRAQELAGHANALADALDTLRSHIEALKGLLAGAAGGSPSAPPSTETTSPGQGPLPDFAPHRIHREPREAMKRIGWPRNAQGSVAARGLLYDRTGRPLLDGKVLPASRSGPGSDTSDLKEPWKSDDRYTTRYHVEGHTAAYMRRNGVAEAVLYLNIPPCGNRAEPDPVRCEANLAAHLPEGSVLYVHSVHPNGTTRSKAYQGTGEALA